MSSPTCKRGFDRCDHLFTVAAVLAAISFTPATPQANIFGLFGFDCGGGHNCGCGQRSGGCGSGCERCGCGCGCGCEPGCGCEAGCGCEPACGCGTGCYANGRQYAGQNFNAAAKAMCRSARARAVQRLLPSGCGCGDCCEPACGCEVRRACCGCGGCCEPAAVAARAAAGRPAVSHKCCLKHCGFCSGCGYVRQRVLQCCARAAVAMAKCIGANGTTIRRAARIRAIATAIGLGQRRARLLDGAAAAGRAIGGCASAATLSSSPCNSEQVATACGRNSSQRTVRTARWSPQQSARRTAQSQPVRTASRPMNRGQMQFERRSRLGRFSGSQSRLDRFVTSRDVRQKPDLHDRNNRLAFAVV